MKTIDKCDHWDFSHGPIKIDSSPLPPLFEHDDWLYVAQCLHWLADRSGASGDRARRLARRIEELSR
jgi:hypothetical protein